MLLKIVLFPPLLLCLAANWIGDGVSDCRVLEEFGTNYTNAVEQMGWELTDDHWCCGDAAGITCSPDARVVELRMDGKDIEGVIPSSFSLLDALEYLSAGYNKLTSVLAMPPALV